ncbi:MAG: hydroxymethylglutaryl-CoA lyase [Comamonadaceae bacterium]|jgi:hydroxymethylglutaryl-CoA lyase|nr:hydroxymethylglutaryl-CoA lyase [Comamonadaceae bacterium]
MPTRIFFNEVVTRDGFQNEPAFVETADKVALIDELSQCGFAKIEVTAFVSPKAIPMLRDAEEVMGRITRRAAVQYTALVPNVRGAERALEARADELNLVMSVSQTHNLANLRMTREKSFAAIKEVVTQVNGQVPINVSLSTAFGCPMQGQIELNEVMDWARRFADLGVRGLTLCDTTGMANPRQVRLFSDAVVSSLGRLELTMHFHNTRGMGLANVLAAVESGITSFDGSLGGLGGCPYAPGASGNICTEDTIHMLQTMGLETGVDLERLIHLARALPGLVGHPTPGQLAQAGRACDLHPVPEHVKAMLTH